MNLLGFGNVHSAKRLVWSRAQVSVGLIGLHTFFESFISFGEFSAYACPLYSSTLMTAAFVQRSRGAGSQHDGGRKGGYVGIGRGDVGASDRETPFRRSR